MRQSKNESELLSELIQKITTKSENLGDSNTLIERIDGDFMRRST